MPKLNVGDYHWVYHFANSKWEIAIIGDQLLGDGILYFKFYNCCIKKCDSVNYVIKPIKKYKG